MFTEMEEQMNTFFNKQSSQKEGELQPQSSELGRHAIHTYMYIYDLIGQLNDLLVMAGICSLYG